MDHKDFARLGGKARARKLTDARRKEIAKAAAARRWHGHAKPLPKSS